MPNVPPFQPDQRSWRERERKDKRIRVRDRNAYVRPDKGTRPTDQRVRDRTAYARPDNGKRPKHHSGGHNLKAAIASPLDGQLASRSTAADDCNDTEVGEESEMDSLGCGPSRCDDTMLPQTSPKKTNVVRFK